MFKGFRGHSSEIWGNYFSVSLYFDFNFVGLQLLQFLSKSRTLKKLKSKRSEGCKYYANLYLTEGILTEGIYVPFCFMYHFILCTMLMLIWVWEGEVILPLILQNLKAELKIVTFYLTKPESRIKKSLTQLSQYCFEWKYYFGQKYGDFLQKMLT